MPPSCCPPKKRKASCGTSAAHAASPAGESVALVHKEWNETTKAGKSVARHSYCTPYPQPTFMNKNVTVVEGARYERRPSYIAKQSGKRTITEVTWPDPIVMGEWEEEDEFMPPEKREEDTGWKPGPIERALPPFTGPTPGPSDPSINADSTPREIMLHQITEE